MRSLSVFIYIEHQTSLQLFIKSINVAPDTKYVFLPMVVRYGMKNQEDFGGTPRKAVFLDSEFALSVDLGCVGLYYICFTG